MKRVTLRLVVLALLLSGMGQVRADTIVLPNANTSVSGNSPQFGILDTSDATFQWVYSASQLSSVVGEAITSIGFRLPAGTSTLTTPLVYSEWNLQLGTSLNAPGSLSSTFAANQGPDGFA